MLKDKFNEFFNQWNGKPCEVNDPSNANQCFDLAYAWLDKLQITRDAIRHLLASEIWTKPNDLTIKFFEMIPNTPNGMPQCGDIVIFSTKVGIAGHVSIANGEGNVASFTSVDQNWGTDKKCRLVTHPYDAVLGWLRPRVGLIPIPLPGPVIVDSTIIDLGPVAGKLEVQAIRSEIVDSRRAIEDYKLRVSELEAQLTLPDAFQGLVTQIHDIVWGRGWIWIQRNHIRELLPR